MKTEVLDHDQILRICNRFAFQILENSIDYDVIHIIGIKEKGFDIAKIVERELKSRPGLKREIIRNIVTYIAVSMITQGVNNILSPQQDTRNSQSREDPLDPSSLASNYSFTGLTNISQAGIPVNLAYGEILVGSIVVSNGIDTVQVEGTNWWL